MPQLERFLAIWKVFYSYVQAMKRLVFALSATLLCLVRYNFVEKKWIFNGIFQVGACPNLKDSLISEYFSLHTYKTYRVRYHHFCAICDSLMLRKVHYFGKRWFFHEIFQVGACPNLKDPFLYDRFSIHMYKAWNIRYFQQFSSVCDSLMPSKVHFLEKDEFLMEYFKLVHAPTWKIP